VDALNQGGRLDSVNIPAPGWCLDNEDALDMTAFNPLVLGSNKLLWGLGQHFAEVANGAQLPSAGKLGYCYQNALRAIADDPSLTYVEGYAIATEIPVPLEHAWCVDTRGVVWDPTWNTSTAHKPEVIQYFGMLMHPRFVSKINGITGYYGVLSNLWLARTYLKRVKLRSIIPKTSKCAC
jgi:hypothetical protein